MHLFSSKCSVRLKSTVFSKLTQKNGSSSRIGLRFHPKKVIFLIKFNDIYLIAQKFIMQFLKIWSCNASLACPDRTPLEHTNIIILKPDITPEECREKPQHIHTTITLQYLSSRKSNKVTNTTP